MKISQIQPGYRVNPELHELVKDYAAELTNRHGFHVSVNKALAVLIRKGYEEFQQEPERG